MVSSGKWADAWAGSGCGTAPEPASETLLWDVAATDAGHCWFTLSRQPAQQPGQRAFVFQVGQWRRGQCDFPMEAVNRARSGSPHPSSGQDHPPHLCPTWGLDLGPQWGGRLHSSRAVVLLSPSTQLTDSQPEAGAELGEPEACVAPKTTAGGTCHGRDSHLDPQPHGTRHTQPRADDRLPSGAPENSQGGA